MQKLLFIIALMGSLCLTGCFIDIDDDEINFGCLDGEGPLVTEELFLPDLRGIDLQMSAKVILRIGDQQEILVSGKPNIIDELELDASNGIWEIETDRCVRDLGPMEFFITLPVFDVIRLSGSGEIFGEDVIVIDDLDIRLTGSGDIDLAVDCEEVDIRQSGSGTILLEGVTDELEYDLSGSGDLRAFNLETEDTEIELTGSGDADVRVNDRLRVRISGSGDVRFKGNPELDVNISGSGSVIDAN